MSCGAPEQGVPLEGVDMSAETVIAGVVLAGDEPVGGAYVRLLDAQGEFTAEVVTSPHGDFRFFARPGRWTVRALSPSGNGEMSVEAAAGEQAPLTLRV
jgi:uncharacterized GH25 family protein